mmetsp:Transcript_43528/g.87123  ORF Transcript_43528/g.87123 Transcript_43528/m.87123 type:complete len:216 (-) Transcript_43528:292-939(-)
MSNARSAREEANAEKERRERERREFKEAQELESLRRTFKRINKKNDGKIGAQDLVEELEFLGFRVTEKEAALTVWEVDDDNDGLVDWDEFRTMFYRVRDDQSGCEPRKLFNLVDFLMLDKNHSGSVDMDECVTLLWSRYGKDPVDENLKAMQVENHPSLQGDAANEKNVNFSFFSEIQRRCKKKALGSGIRKDATTVPQVKELPYVTNPQFQHLL